jgi:hypothetical protein
MMLAADADQVARRVPEVHAHERGRPARLAAHQGEVKPPVHAVHVPAHAERTGGRLDHAVSHALDRAFLAEPVADEVRDRADDEAMLPGKALELRTPRHRPIVVQHLDDHRRRLEAREPREVTARLGVPRARQHAARASHQRKHVAGLAQVFRPGVVRDRSANRARAVLRRYPGGDALGGLDAHGEVRAVPVLGLAHHQRQSQPPATVLGERQADEAATVPRHEIDVLGPHTGRGHQQVTLVLPVLVIHDHDHASRSELGQDFLDRVQRVPRMSSSRSM